MTGNRGITIWRLNDHTCRWPQGEPEEPAVFFCGATTHPGFPYCTAHCRRAFLHFQRRLDGGREEAAA